jgi:hypothetical protein
VPTGHLVYLGERETLMAVAFDAERLETVGRVETMLGRVSQTVRGFTSHERALAGHFAIAPRTGHLAYLQAYSAVPPATAQGIIAQQPEVSPDGRWFAYTQDSGALDTSDVWLQRFPGLGGKRMVSVKGGGSPAWNPRGGEIIYIARPEPSRADPNYVRHLMVVDVTETPAGIDVGTPRPLFDTRRTYVDGKAEKP